MPSSLPGRQPITTQSIVRSRFTFAIPLRLPGMYGASSCFAITPSMLPSHFSACAGSALSGVSSNPAVSAIASSRRRRSHQRRFQQRFVALGQEVEDDVAGGDLLREQFDPRLRRVDPALQGVEFEVAVGVADHQLAVQHPAPRPEAELREVAAQRFTAARLDVDLVAVDEDDRPEAVELRLIHPFLADRQLFARQRQLRLDRWRQRKGHPAVAAPWRRVRLSRGSGIGTAASSFFVYGSDGCSQTWSAVALLDDLALVHHRDPVRDVADDADVVGDEEVGEAELVLEVVE